MTIITSPVRKARPEDRQAVIDICVQDASENAQFPLCMEKLEQKVSDILDGNGGVIGLIQRKEVEAIILLQIGNPWYSQTFCLEETLNYVRPEFRRSTNAKDMINFAKRCSDELGIPLMIGVVSNERTKPKLELYRRQLGEPAGGYFLHFPKQFVRPVAPKAVAG